MKLNYYLLPLFTLLAFTLYAQNAKLSGKVTEENGDALISANVVIDASKGWAAITDLDGNYEINLPSGAYTVTFSFVGKNEYKQQVILAAGEKRVLNVTLIEKQKLMDEVEITGSKYEKKLSEETVSMDVVKGNSLTSQNIVSLDQGMNKIPSVTIADGQVNIRGGAGWSYGAGSRVQVLLDDLPLLTADAQDAKWSIVPMENVDQIEVIKGAASALYGSSALDGIVNIRTAYPTDEPYASVTVYSGGYESPTKTPDMDWWGDNTPVFSGANFAYREKFGQSDLVLGGAFDGNTGYLDSSDAYQVRGTLKYRYRFKKVQGLNLGVNASAAYSWGKTFFFWNGLDSMGYRPYQGTVTIYKDYRFTVDPFIEYYDKHNDQFKFISRFLNATNTNTTQQGSVPDLYYTEFQFHRKFEFHKFDFNLLSGVVNQYNSVEPPADATNSLFGKNTQYNFSAYAQTDFKFFQKLNVSLGARWEYFTQSHFEKDSTVNSITGPDTIFNYYQKLVSVQNSLKQLSYPLARAGLNYQAADATYLRASFGQGFRYPSIAERYISTNVGPITIASNPDLQPEKGYSAEIGIKQGFKMGSNWRGYADLSGFWNEYNNMMEFSFGQYGDTTAWKSLAKDFGLGFSSQNIGKTRILGAEFDIAGEGSLGPLQLDLVAGYTYIDPVSLNWNDSLALYNYQGVELTNGATNRGVQAGAYNNPQDLPYITYSQTSSSGSNILKYRSKHTLKFDITFKWKGLEWNTNMQYSSFEQNIDYVFVSPLLKTLYSGPFAGLAQYREEKMDIPIGDGRGDIIWNADIAYNFKQGVRVAFIVKNLLNWEYTPRPAYFGEPRNFTVQLTYVFKGKNKKEKSSLN